MNTFYKYIMGITTGLCALTWNIPEPTSEIVGLIAAIITISMAGFSLGVTVREKKEQTNA